MEQIVEQLEIAIKRVFGDDFLTNVAADLTIEVTPAPDDTGADYASNIAMKLFGYLKSDSAVLNVDNLPDLDTDTLASPRDLALFLRNILSEAEGFPFSTEVAGPGFINFISSDEYWQHKLVDIQRNFQEYISCNEYSGQQVVCEFSDPNPFKVLHVGHLYTSIMGESISRLVEYAGGKVIRANFGGDVGLHVAKTIYAIKKHNLVASQIKVIPSDGADSISQKIQIIADCYVEGTRAYEDDPQAKDAITKLNKKIYEIAAAGPDQQNDEEVASIYWAGRELSYRYFDDFYRQVGVSFDRYYPESTVAKRGLVEVQSHLGTIYEESNGAVIFPGEKYGLHTRVFINAEGLPTYEAKDVGLIFTKWDDYHFDKSIVITGNDIIDYMKVVLCSISQYAPELPARTLHITHGNVRLPGNEKMSSRKGNFIKAVDVINDVERQLIDNAIAENLHLIAMAAIKYAFLKYKIGGNIEFDIKESVSTTGNSGVYLQYSGVRAKKILAALSSGASSQAVVNIVDWKLNVYEKVLIRKITQYKDILNEAVKELAPHKIANYLYDLAQEFSRFYEHVKVAGSEHETERSGIVAAYYDVLEHGLEILGIKIPEEM